MDEKYELTTDLNNFIIETFNERADTVFNIIQLLYKINSIYSLELNFFMDKLEYRILERIAIASEVHDAVLAIELYLKKSIVEFFKRLTVLLSNDEDYFTLEVAEDFLNSFMTILSLDAYNSKEMLNIINNDDIDGNEKLVNIISEYATVNTEKIFNIVLSVGDTLFERLTRHFNAVIYRNDAEMNERDINAVSPLINKDKNFGFTRIIKNGLYYGLNEFIFEKYIDTLYKILDSYKEDSISIAYEIYATNFLSKDKPIVNPEKLQDIVNIKALATTKDKYELADEIIKQYIELDKIVKG